MAVDEWERERWRGEISGDVAQHEEQLRKLWAWQADTATEMAVLKTKVAQGAALGAAIGSMAGGLVVALVIAFIQRAIK